MMHVEVDKTPIERRLTVHTCSRCGNMIQTLEEQDAAQAGVQEGKPFVCRKCRREEENK